MTHLSGNNWSGTFNFSDTLKACGRFHSYSWCFQAKANSWFLEIAQDHTIEPNQLPLVGYGVGGWLYECDNSTIPTIEADFITFINSNITKVFTLFEQNKLKYVPAITACND